MARDLEQEILISDHVRQRCRNRVYAQQLYAALCNMQWQPSETWSILKGEVWSCSWRHAGAVVADIRNSLTTEADGARETETYLDWYCSGILLRWENDDDEYVAEGTVSGVIRQDLAALGWYPVARTDEED
jgi:hypothetical protein